MKVITLAHLESWRQSKPALIDVEYGPVEALRSKDGTVAAPHIIPIRCKFANPVPRLPATTEIYLLDTTA